MMEKDIVPVNRNVFQADGATCAVEKFMPLVRVLDHEVGPSRAQRRMDLAERLLLVAPIREVDQDSLGHDGVEGGFVSRQVEYGSALAPRVLQPRTANAPFRAYAKVPGLLDGGTSSHSLCVADCRNGVSAPYVSQGLPRPQVRQDESLFEPAQILVEERDRVRIFPVLLVPLQEIRDASGCGMVALIFSPFVAMMPHRSMMSVPLLIVNCLYAE